MLHHRDLHPARADGPASAGVGDPLMAAAGRGQERGLGSANYLLPLGLALSTATSLRLDALPVGIGEALLALWAAIGWINIIGRKNIRVAPELRPYVYFFVVFLLTLLVSTVFQIARNNGLVLNAGRDLIAFLFAGALVITFALLRPPVATTLKLTKTLVLVIAGALGGLLLLSLGTRQIGGMTIHAGVRFLGWSANPNQTALALIALPFLSTYFCWTAPRLFERVAFLLALGFSITAGLATRSDALTVAWVAASGLLVALYLLLKMQRILIKPTTGTQQWVTLWHLLALASALAVVIIMTPAGQDLYGTVAHGDEGGVRLMLWRESLRLAQESLIIGIGPGLNVQVYELGELSEAHNSYLDLLVATGMIGLGGFIASIIAVTFRSRLLEQPVLCSGFVAILGFSALHYTTRHPIFWFYLILISTIAFHAHRPRHLARPAFGRPDASLSIPLGRRQKRSPAAVGPG